MKWDTWYAFCGQQMYYSVAMINPFRLQFTSRTDFINPAVPAPSIEAMNSTAGRWSRHPTSALSPALASEPSIEDLIHLVRLMLVG
jgi:hypothetical protein